MNKNSYMLRNLNAEDSYLHANFGVKYLISKEIGSAFTGVAARIRNSMALALREIVTPLPKLIFVVLEDDLICDLYTPDEVEVHIKYGKICNWLCNEFRKMIAGHVDALPPNARRNVHIIWLLPTYHINYGK